jgi:serine/threonine protein kinase
LFRMLIRCLCINMHVWFSCLHCLIIIPYLRYWLVCGIFLIFLTLSSYALCEENEKGIFDAILHGHIDFASDPWPKISSSAKDLIKKMLQGDPKERISAVEVLSKFYFSWKCKLICFASKGLCCILIMLTLRISQALLTK